MKFKWKLINHFTIFLYYKICFKLHLTRNYLIVYAKIPITDALAQMYWEVVVNVPLTVGMSHHTMMLWEKNPGYIFVPQIVRKISKLEANYYTQMNNYYKNLNLTKTILSARETTKNNKDSQLPN